MENFINELILEIEGAPAKAGFVKKMARRVRSLGIRHQITNRIEEVNVLMVEIMLSVTNTRLMSASIRVLSLWFGFLDVDGQQGGCGPCWC